MLLPLAWLLLPSKRPVVTISWERDVRSPSSSAAPEKGGSVAMTSENERLVVCIKKPEMEKAG